ncbi:unnamed protein product [Trichogramma brassicae]|uniref:Uncharacterized protein n=1 Tax=Trichogramma brassicae TaxID=86971 RepID=A0A6H5I4Q3_9HYME|nr:unnamed protein product [Trichogramma brassicae]
MRQMDVAQVIELEARFDAALQSNDGIDPELDHDFERNFRRNERLALRRNLLRDGDEGQIVLRPREEILQLRNNGVGQRRRRRRRPARQNARRNIQLAYAAENPAQRPVNGPRGQIAAALGIAPAEPPRPLDAVQPAPAEPPRPLDAVQPVPAEPPRPLDAVQPVPAALAGNGLAAGGPPQVNFPEPMEVAPVELPRPLDAVQPAAAAPIVNLQVPAAPVAAGINQADTSRNNVWPGRLDDLTERRRRLDRASERRSLQRVHVSALFSLLLIGAAAVALLLARRPHRGHAQLVLGRFGELVLAADVGQAPDLRGLGDLEQRPDLLLRHVDLALVHELDRGLELRPLDVLHDDDRMLALVVAEERLEVRAAGRQYHLVSLDRILVAGERHVDEAFRLQQLIEHVGEVRLVVVPAQAELLGRAGAAQLLGRRSSFLVGLLGPLLVVARRRLQRSEIQISDKQTVLVQPLSVKHGHGLRSYVGSSVSTRIPLTRRGKSKSHTGTVRSNVCWRCSAANQERQSTSCSVSHERTSEIYTEEPGLYLYYFKTNSVEHGHVSANWLLQFEQKFFKHIDQRFKEFSLRLSLLEDIQAQQTADLSQQSAATEELRATCCAEFATIRNELRSEVEAMQNRISTSSDPVSLPIAVLESEDSCEVRFGGVPCEVDATTTATATKILKAMGLARFGSHIVRVREWIDRYSHTSARPATRQILSSVNLTLLVNIVSDRYIMTWIGIIGEEFIGPYFFEVNITGRLYAGFLRRIALPRLREVNPDAWWQQDGSPVHGSRKSRANLNSLFPNRWIGRGGPIPWPAKSPDLTVCDYGLWADLKRRVHKRGVSV